MKRLTKHWPWVLLMVAALLLVTACGTDDSTSPTCVEVDIDHPKAKHPKTQKPKPPAPQPKAPTTRRR